MRAARMSTPPKSEDVPSPAADDRQEGRPAASGLGGKIMEQYRKTKEHAETYPYVWGSYILVYGTLGAWLSFRWIRLRNMEARVRVLQERIRKQAEAEELAESSAVSSLPAKPASSAKKDLPLPDKVAK